MNDIDVTPLLFFGILFGMWVIGFLSGYLANEDKGQSK